MYHYIRKIKDSKYPEFKGLEIESFKKQLNFLESKFSIISAEDLIDFKTNNKSLPNKSCILTFDDGYKDHFANVFPELKKRNLKGLFFPPGEAIIKRKMLGTNKIHYIFASTKDKIKLVKELNNLLISHDINKKVLGKLWKEPSILSRFDSKEEAYIKRVLQHEAISEKIRNIIFDILFKRYVTNDPYDFADKLYMSIEEIKTLINEGMYVGSHTMKHFRLNKLTKTDQDEEISNSIKFLNSLGAPTQNWIMCYPYGAYNSDTLDLLYKKNCVFGLTTRVGEANLKKENFLELPRFDTNDFPQ